MNWQHKWSIACAMGLVIVASAMAGCTNTREAYKLAGKDPTKVSWVTGELYSAWQTEAIRMKENGTLNGSALSKGQELELVASETVTKALGVAKTYEAAQTAENEEALRLAYLDAANAVADFVQFLKSVKGNPNGS